MKNKDKNLLTSQQIIGLNQTLRTSEDSPDVNDDVDRVGQQFEGEFCLQEGVDLLYVVRDVLADVLKDRKTGLKVRKNRVTAERKKQEKQKWRRAKVSSFKRESRS